MKKGFTLSEVLITLAIIGVVAALTIPAVVKNYQEMQFKTAYKKTYSDMNKAFAQALAFGEFPQRTDCHDVNFANFVNETLKENFKVIKDCPKGHAVECWTPADTVYSPAFPNGQASAFVDSQGRVWAEFYSTRSIYLVDTNGSKAPNRFGKDRWVFAFKNKNGGDCEGITVRIMPYIGDVKTSEDPLSYWCNYPPCYYYSWLFK